MAILSSPAIPVRISEYSETSLITAFFTRDYGLVRAIYKGARRKAKAYENSIDLLVYGELSFYERSTGLNIVKQFKTMETFPALSGDLARYRAAMSILEFIRRLIVENEPAVNLFDLFRDALKACASIPDPWIGSYVFITRGLFEAGFAPSFDACASCTGRDFPQGSNARTAFSFEEGGVLCKKCGPARKVGMWLTKGTINMLRKLAAMKPSSARFKMSPVLAREVRRFLKRFCEFTFEQRFLMLK